MVREPEINAGDEMQLDINARFGDHAGKVGIVAEVIEPGHPRRRPVYVWECEDKHRFIVVAGDLRHVISTDVGPPRSTSRPGK